MKSRTDELKELLYANAKNIAGMMTALAEGDECEMPLANLIDKRVELSIEKAFLEMKGN